MKLIMIFRLVPMVIMTITQTESLYVERWQKLMKIARSNAEIDAKRACNRDVRASLHYVENQQDSHHTAKPFYIASDTHEETVLAVPCDGTVVAKHKTVGCNSNNIITRWDASCGNVAFMPCENDAELLVGTSFEICVAGFRDYSLVYDEDSGYFKISHKTRRRNNNGIVHVKAHVVGENQIYIFPVERQETESGARRMVLDGPIPTFKNPNSTTSYHMNLKFSFSN